MEVRSPSLADFDVVAVRSPRLVLDAAVAARRSRRSPVISVEELHEERIVVGGGGGVEELAAAADAEELDHGRRIRRERVEECHGVIVEIMGSGVANNSKRKSYYCCDEPPPSPNGVISTCFSYESSSSMDSWPMWPSSVSSSPEPAPPPAKRAHFE